MSSSNALDWPVTTGMFLEGFKGSQKGIEGNGSSTPFVVKKCLKILFSGLFYFLRGTGGFQSLSYRPI